MKIAKIFAWIALALSMTGCVNLYVRCPGTPSKINTVPQVISWRGAQVEARSSTRETFVMENLITIPIGCIGFCDTALEAVVDTVCLPYDWPISNYRINHIRRDAEFQPCYCK